MKLLSEHWIIESVSDCKLYSLTDLERNFWHHTQTAMAGIDSAANVVATTTSFVATTTEKRSVDFANTTNSSQLTDQKCHGSNYRPHNHSCDLYNFSLGLPVESLALCHLAPSSSSSLDSTSYKSSTFANLGHLRCMVRSRISICTNL